MTNEQAWEIVENWFNKAGKKSIIDFANANNLDIGQNEELLHEDWDEKICDFAFEFLMREGFLISK